MPDGKMNDEGMNSLNHYSYGSIEAWMYREVCGINPVQESPGFKKTYICPHPDKRLGYVEGILESSSGRYSCEWKYDEAGKVRYKLTIPFDTEATVELPQGNYMLNQETKISHTLKIECGTYIIEEL